MSYRNLRELLLGTGERFETAVAFYEKKQGFYQQISYGRLLEESEALGVALAARLPQGARVLLVAEGGYPRTLSLLSLLSFGYSVVSVTGNADTARLSGVAAHAAATAVLYDATGEACAKALPLPALSLGELPALIAAGKQAISGGAWHEEAAIPDGAPAMLFYTARGRAVFTQQALLAAAHAAAAAQELDERDIFLSVLPAAAAEECVLGLFAPLSVGASVAFGEGLSHLMKNMREVHPTAMVTVPYIAAKIHDKFFAMVAENGTETAVRRAIAASDPVRPLAARRALKERLLAEARLPFGGALRRLLVVGGQLPATVTKGLRQIGISAVATYTVPVVAGAVAMTTDACYRDGTAGQVLPTVAVTLTAQREDGAGIVELSGEALSLDVREGAKTGDVARLDAEGYLAVIGTVSALIPRDGVDFVCPEELEAQLLQSPVIADAALLADDKGELTALLVADSRGIEAMLGEEYTEDEITLAVEEWIEELNSALPVAHRVAQFALLEAPLPRSKTGRLQRDALKALL